MEQTNDAYVGKGENKNLKHFDFSWSEKPNKSPLIMKSNIVVCFYRLWKQVTHKSANFSILTKCYCHWNILETDLLFFTIKNEQVSNPITSTIPNGVIYFWKTILPRLKVFLSKIWGNETTLITSLVISIKLCRDVVRKLW